MWMVEEARLTVRYSDGVVSVFNADSFTLEVDGFYVLKNGNKFVALIDRKNVVEIVVN